MQYKGMNLCDFCFEPIADGTDCPNCGLTHEKYSADAGLLLPGTNLMGKYIIGRVLGRGGFGATYLAYSSEREERVAIKEYFPNGIAYRGKGEEKIAIVSDDKRNVFQKGAKRFFDEAKTMSRFNNNENVVSVYEFFYANDTVYYSMEYLEGIDLKGYVAKKGGKLQEGEALSIMRYVCNALVAIHSTGTLHRDISPDNIFICTDGRVKLIDFGAAKQVVGEQSQSLSVILKQGFAPVEQYKKDGRQGMWTDIYALGATIYYALVGKVAEDAMSRLENPEIVFDSSLNISPQMSDVINKCMRIKIDDRYQSALELLDALQEIPVQPLPIGGREYVQTVYAPGKFAGVNGVPVRFTQLHNTTQYAPQSQYLQSQYPQSQYPNSQYLNSQYYSTNEQMKKSEKSGVVKGAIVAAAAVIILALVIFVIVKLVSPRQEQGAMPQQQQQQQQPMPQGGPLPQGGMPQGGMPQGGMPQGGTPGQPMN